MAKAECGLAVDAFPDAVKEALARGDGMNGWPVVAARLERDRRLGGRPRGRAGSGSRDRPSERAGWCLPSPSMPGDGAGPSRIGG